MLSEAADTVVLGPVRSSMRRAKRVLKVLFPLQPPQSVACSRKAVSIKPSAAALLIVFFEAEVGMSGRNVSAIKARVAFRAKVNVRL